VCTPPPIPRAIGCEDHPCRDYDLDSLDEQQKRVFGFLSREMMRMRHQGMEMGMGMQGMGPGGHHRWHGAEEGGPDEEE
jgi:hypothetical protein